MILSVLKGRRKEEMEEITTVGKRWGTCAVGSSTVAVRRQIKVG